MDGPPQGAREGALGDPRFFLCAGPFSLGDVAAAAGTPCPAGMQDRMLSGVATLAAATSSDVSFIHNQKYLADAENTAAGAVIVSSALSARLPDGVVPLVAEDPYLAWSKVGWLFHPAETAAGGIHPTAVIDPSASLGEDVQVGPHAVIGRSVMVGARSVIGAGAVISPGVVMGEGCRIGALASVTHAVLGHRVYVYPGARIGQEGFGFAMTGQGFVTVPQLGRVILEDDVEIGANSTVDRGGARDTVIRRGSRIDNLVQIGHNVQIGRYCALAGQSGVAGSSILEDFAQLGAQAGIAGHVTIGTKARVGAQGGVMSNVPAGADVIGSPALPVREFFRNVAALRRLARRSPQERTAG